jgi:hypothetical protein
MLRRGFVFLVAVVAIAALPAVGLATHASGESPRDDLVAGTVHFTGVLGTSEFRTTIHIDAHGGPLEKNPQGHIRASQDALGFEVDFRVDVTCLTATGNRATLGGRVTESRLPFPAEGSGFVLTVQDNGEPAGMDQAQGLFTAVPPLVCPAPFGAVLFQQGNLVVHDSLS